MFRGSMHSNLPLVKGTVIGIVAGSGELPEILIKEVLKKGYACVVLSIDSDRKDQLSRVCKDLFNISIKEGGRGIRYFKEKKVTHIVFVGKVFKTSLYNEAFQPDEVTEQILHQTVHGRGDEHILRVVEAIVKMNRFKVLGLSDFLHTWIPSKGVLSQAVPTKAQLRDIRYGVRMAKRIGKLDIGQCVVVKDCTVMAVEGIEGTNKMIQRVYESGISGSILVKVSKPQQNMKFDMPVVGMETIMNAIDAECSAIVIEAKRTLLVQYEQLLKKINQQKMVLYGV